MSNPVAIVQRINDRGDRYHALAIWCPGCQYLDDEGRPHGGLHMLAVSGDKKKRPTWDWNGDLEKVTLSPSILTKFNHKEIKIRCHSFLRDGVWQFLGDCTHVLKNKHVPMVPLPDWLIH